LNGRPCQIAGLSRLINTLEGTDPDSASSRRARGKPGACPAVLADREIDVGPAAKLPWFHNCGLHTIEIEAELGKA
jgi:hypothetical protein